MTAIDVSKTIIARSDQLNADDLIGGPITVQITDVSVHDGEQPVVLAITGHQPWKPCKTMRRVLVVGWGADASQWIGRWVMLHRDPAVKFGGDAVGGIRVSSMSHIPKRIEVSLGVSKGKKSKHVIEILKPAVMSVEEFQRACSGALRVGWTREQVAKALGGKAADVPPEKRRDFAAMFTAAPVEAEGPPESAPITDEERAEILAREKADA